MAEESLYHSEDEDKNSEENAANDCLETKLTLDNLKQLQTIFADADNGSEENKMELQQFIDTIRKVTNSDAYQEQATRIFEQRAITEGATSTLTWSSFLDHLMQTFHHLETLNLSTQPFLDLDYNTKLLTHNRRESTVKILSIAAPNFIYVFLSQLGTVGILDSDLRLKNVYMVDLEDRQRDFVREERRICRSWATDIVHMSDCKKLVIGSTNRTLHFYDISAATHMEEFRVFGLPDAPTCFTYCSKEDHQNGSLLFFGDDIGSVHCLRFKQPETLLFKKVNMEGSTRVFFMDLDRSRDYVEHWVLDKVHSSRITRLQYAARGSRLVSCSEDAEAPLVIRDIHCKLKVYTFQVTKGIQCFDYDRALNLLVTGSRDFLVRFWNSYVPKQPQAILKGHEVTVIDIKILSEKDMVISYSGDMVIKTWDLLKHTCIQSLQLKFPIPRRLATSDPGHSAFPLHIDTFLQKTVLVACRDYVIQLRLVDDKKEGILLQTSGTSESTKIQNDSQKFSSEMKTGAAAVTLHTSLPSLIQEPLKAPYQSESEALEEFGTYVFTKLDHYEGHVSRTEMRNMVERGLPFRALKVSLPDSVHVDPNIPSLDRIRGSQVQSETGNASCDSTWIRSPSFDSGQSGSYHLTSPRSRGGRLRLPSLMFDPRIELGSQSSSGGSTSHEKFHDNK